MGKSLCIIPARGGSKRIPKKNIKLFFGKPIISYPISLAINSGLFEDVIVSTDCEDIAKISKEYGAQVPFFRTNKNSDDYATLSDVVEEVKSHYQDKGYSTICCILPTSPLLTENLLSRGLAFFESTKADSIKPIVKFSYPIQRSLKLNKTGKVSYMYEKYVSSRSQDLEIAYFDSGMFYWMDFEKALIGASKYAFEISEMEAQDIDTLEDWKMAELKYSLQSNELK